jgi:hypothetical protein
MQSPDDFSETLRQRISLRKIHVHKIEFHLFRNEMNGTLFVPSFKKFVSGKSKFQNPGDGSYALLGANFVQRTPLVVVFVQQIAPGHKSGIKFVRRFVQRLYIVSDITREVVLDDVFKTVDRIFVGSDSERPQHFAFENRRNDQKRKDRSSCQDSSGDLQDFNNPQIARFEEQLVVQQEGVDQIFAFHAVPNHSQQYQNAKNRQPNAQIEMEDENLPVRSLHVATCRYHPEKMRR